MVGRVRGCSGSGSGGEGFGESRAGTFNLQRVLYLDPPTMAKSVSAVKGNQAKPQQKSMEPSALRLQTAARVMFALAAQSRSSPYKSPPRRANQSEHDVAASLQIPRSPPMQFQPVSRSTHAVCTSGTLHIVPLLHRSQSTNQNTRARTAVVS